MVSRNKAAPAHPGAFEVFKPRHFPQQIQGWSGNLGPGGQGGLVRQQDSWGAPPGLMPSGRSAGTWPPLICQTVPGGPAWVDNKGGGLKPEPRRPPSPAPCPHPHTHLASHLLDLIPVENEAPPHELVTGEES